MEEPAFVTTTRAGYDAIAQGYADAFRAPLANAPLDRGLLAGSPNSFGVTTTTRRYSRWVVVPATSPPIFTSWV